MEERMADPVKTIRAGTGKKIPQRKCVGCGQMKDKNTLMRICLDEQGNVSIDRRGKADGRGAYICSAACLKKAQKARALERSLKCAVPAGLYLQLEKEMTTDEE